MQDPSKVLGRAVKAARAKLGITQIKLAELIGKSERTVIKIEQGEDNPKLDGLFLLVRVLRIEPRELFYPETKEERPSVKTLLNTIEQCTEKEAATLIPVVESVLSALRKKNDPVDFE